MKISDHYLKIVEWDDEDQCYIGRCPGLMLGGIHGKDEMKVYRELCETAEEWIKIHQVDGLVLPPSTAGKQYPGTFLLRLGKDLHEKLAVKAIATGESLNRFCRRLLEKAVSS